LRGEGVSAELAKMAFAYAIEHNFTVEVICPVIRHFIRKHQEYWPLIHRNHPV
jgi:uncharacterized protein